MLVNQCCYLLRFWLNTYWHYHEKEGLYGMGREVNYCLLYGWKAASYLDG